MKTNIQFPNSVERIRRIISNTITNLLPMLSEDSACYLLTVQFNGIVGPLVQLFPHENRPRRHERGKHT